MSQLRASGPRAAPPGVPTSSDRYRQHADHADLGLIEDDRTPDMRTAPAVAPAEAQINAIASQQKEKIMHIVARPDFPRTSRRDHAEAIILKYYEGTVTIVDDVWEWLPGADLMGEHLGLTGTEYASTAKLIAEKTDCTIGDAAAVEVMSR
jgi:hypothetical protein